MASSDGFGRQRSNPRVATRRLSPVVVVGLLALALSPSNAAASPADGRSAAELELRLGPGVTVSVHEATGAVRFIGTRPGRPIPRPAGIPASAPATLTARAFLERYGDHFGLRDPARELRTEAVDAAPGGFSIRFGQVHEGVRVLGGELVVNLDRERNMLSVSGETLPSEALETPRLEPAPAVAATEAEQSALAAVARAHGNGVADLRAGEPDLEIYDSRLLGGPGLHRPALVWRVEVRSGGGEPIRELVLVDAQLSSVAVQFNQISHAKDRWICDADNSTAQYPCTSPVRTEAAPPNAVQDVNLAYDFSGQTYDFFIDRFGRDSLDGAGMSLVSTVRWCESLSSSGCPYQNAFWDGEQMVYGQGFAVDDVVGHELTHGVTEFSSKLFYYYQSGAINESLSDVFGEFVDLTNGAGTDTSAVRWLLGEDLPSSTGVIRNMKDPLALGEPDRMTSPNYSADPNEVDGGGVHTNSGVNNKAAYLMTDGDTHNGRTVTGLGIDKVARIYYKAQTELLTSASDYADLYDALNQACANLVGTGGITAADCTEVDDAASAVEMNQDPPAAPAPHAPICPTGATPVNSFFDDLENIASGNWAKTSILGTNGWHYPQNTHSYPGFDATYATSGTNNFWGDNHDTLADFAIAMTSNVTVPPGGYLHFQHAYGFEDTNAPSRAWDGGVLEYSTNDGASWTDAGPLFTDNGYTGTIYSGGSANNPLKGRSAFVRESNGYISSRVDLSPLAGQQVRFRFRIGTDSVAGDYGWFIDDVRIYRCDGADTDPPETTILSGPSGPTNDPTPTFSFDSDELGSSFECRFDANSFGPCSGPGSGHTPAVPLSDGEHTFEVRATDASNNTDPSPASRSFTVDTLAPSAPTINDTDPDSPANDNNPEVKGSAEAGSTVRLFESSACGGGIEVQGPAAAFSSPGLTATVANNVATTFTASATDAAGNPSACSASFAYTEDSIPPEIQISFPQDATTYASAAFAAGCADATPDVCGTASDAVGLTKVEARIERASDSRYWNGASWQVGEVWLTAADTSSWSFGFNPAPDTYTLTARATDTAGNTNPTPTSRSFTIESDPIPDTDPPETTILSGPSGPTNDPTPTFSFDSDELGSSFECRFDANSFGPCSGPGSGHTPAVALSDGEHTFEVRATDASNNTDPSPASRSFTVDTTPPGVVINSGPQGPTQERTPTFQFTTEAGAPVVCSIDSGTLAFGPCSGPSSHAPASPLVDGPYTFRVRATDTAGNAATVTRSFTVQTGGGGTPPPALRANCAGRPATILGSPGIDRLAGTERPDVIVSFGGNDLVRAGAGNDIVCGGDGRDRLVGQAGNDRLLGDGGVDTLWGQGGAADFCNGGPGRDRSRTRGCERTLGIP